MKNPNVLISSDYGAIIVNRNDPFLGTEISTKGFWAKDDIQIITTLLKVKLQSTDRVTLYDVGANIGTHTLAIAKTLHDKVFIRAFEAQRMMYYMTCGTIALNGLFNVEVENIAISDTSDEIINIELPDYTVPNNFGGLELMTPIHSDNMQMIKSKSQLIKTKTLDSYNENVDFIKMDIEGMEDRALAGAVNLFARCRPICFIEIFKTNSQYVVEFFKFRNYAGFLKANDLILIPIEMNVGMNDLKRIF